MARFLRRQKRFLVEVEAEEGRFWVHCNNSGTMLGLLRPGVPVVISPASRPGRRLPYTLELVKADRTWVGVNTLVPNRMLHRAWEEHLLPEAAGYASFHGEAVIGGSRLDGLFSSPGKRLWVEAKNVTLVECDVACFPDAVTQRGQKHLRELMTLVGEGERAAGFYLIQREDARSFSPADFIDPAFAGLFWKAVDAGVEVWPYGARISLQGISLGPRLPLNRR